MPPPSGTCWKNGQAHGVTLASGIVCQAVLVPLADREKRVRKALVYHLQTAGESAWWWTPGGLRNRRQLEELRGKYEGRRCFVMGNGPSLRETDVQLFSGTELTIASNGIFLMFDDMGYKPTFLTVEDRLVAEDRAETLNAITGTQKVFPRDLSYCSGRTRTPCTSTSHATTKASPGLGCVRPSCLLGWYGQRAESSVGLPPRM